jgi:hypothetical protein
MLHLLWRTGWAHKNRHRRFPLRNGRRTHRSCKDRFRCSRICRHNRAAPARMRDCIRRHPSFRRWSQCSPSHCRRNCFRSSDRCSNRPSFRLSRCWSRRHCSSWCRPNRSLRRRWMRHPPAPCRRGPRGVSIPHTGRQRPPSLGIQSATKQSSAQLTSEDASLSLLVLTRDPFRRENEAHLASLRRRPAGRPLPGKAERGHSSARQTSGSQNQRSSSNSLEIRRKAPGCASGAPWLTAKSARALSR